MTATTSKDTWTLSQVEAHLKANLNEYGAAIVCAALFFKIYGRFPKLGLSGYQGEAASFLLDKLPEPEKFEQMEFPFSEGAR